MTKFSPTEELFWLSFAQNEWERSEGEWLGDARTREEIFTWLECLDFGQSFEEMAKMVASKRESGLWWLDMVTESERQLFG